VVSGLALDDEAMSLVEQTEDLLTVVEAAQYELAAELADRTKRELEAFCQELRDKGRRASVGEWQERIAQYRWVSALGGTTKDMGYIGYECLKALRRDHSQDAPEAALQALRDAVGTKQATGGLPLQENRPEGHVGFVLHVRADGEDDVFEGLTIVDQNVPYRGRWRRGLTHYMSKRLRASVERKDK
jgi:hypothetical protein